MRKKILRLSFVTLPFTAASAVASASQPLNIERLLTDHSRWQLVTAADYRITPRTGIPGERVGQLATALRYGLTPRFEINARMQGGSRSFTGGSELGFSSVALGANWLLSPPSNGPALLLEARTQLRSRIGGTARSWPATDFTLTAWHYLDPVVLSLSARLQLPRAYREQTVRIEPGYAWSVTPQVNFAVNQRVTLIGGLSFIRREATRAGGTGLRDASEQIVLRAGLGFALAQRDTLFLSGDLATGGGAGLSLQWYHAF